MSEVPVYGHEITTIDGERVIADFEKFKSVPHVVVAREEDPDATPDDWYTWYEYTDGTKHKYKVTQGEGVRFMEAYARWDKTRGHIPTQPWRVA